MSGEGLVELARRFVALNDELETVRGEIRKAVLNGAGEARPFTQPSRQPGGSQARRDAAAAEEQKIVALIRERPMRTGEIAKAMAAAGSTTIQRLRRLKEQHRVTGGGEDGWSAA